MMKQVGIRNDEHFVCVKNFMHQIMSCDILFENLHAAGSADASQEDEDMEDEEVDMENGDEEENEPNVDNSDEQIINFEDDVSNFI